MYRISTGFLTDNPTGRNRTRSSLSRLSNPPIRNETVLRRQSANERFRYAPHLHNPHSPASAKSRRCIQGLLRSRHDQTDNIPLQTGNHIPHPKEKRSCLSPTPDTRNSRYRIFPQSPNSLLFVSSQTEAPRMQAPL